MILSWFCADGPPTSLSVGSLLLFELVVAVVLLIESPILSHVQWHLVLSLTSHSWLMQSSSTLRIPYLWLLMICILLQEFAIYVFASTILNIVVSSNSVRCRNHIL